MTGPASLIQVMSSKRRSRRIAVIDIGSNSVRLVIYALRGAAALPQFNEKVMAGLGTGLSETGRLWPKGVSNALTALRRYRSILDALDVRDVHAFATAAVREASDGAAFSKQAGQAVASSIRVLSGIEEAELSARGAASGFHQPCGLVGDLGGSSLELAVLKDREVQSGETFMLGPLSLSDFSNDDTAARSKHIRKTLKSSQSLAAKLSVFYAVGGAWRAFAKVHMDMTGYPLHSLQGYRMSARDVRKTIKAIDSDEPEFKARIAIITRRRAASLPHAAAVLDGLFARGHFSELIISSYGVREGILMAALGQTERDAMLDAITEAARLSRLQRAFGEQLYRFIKPVIDLDPDLFGSRRQPQRIIKAACLYADSGALYHPDHRARLAYDHALLGPYASATHVERSFIALALATRYRRRFTPPEKDSRLMTDRQTLEARRIGALMRIGCVLSGRSAPILARASLRRSKNKLTLSLAADSKDMVSAIVRRRLTQAANSLSLDPAVSFGS